MSFKSLILFTLVGMVAGYLLVHPFAMLVYVLDPRHAHESLGLSLWHRQLKEAYNPAMVAMGLAFALMGGLAGLSLGAWHLQKLEAQRRLAALETLRRLMVTLAHHIRNANLVVGGFSARLERHLTEPSLKAHVRLIQEASRDIEKVIAALESLREITPAVYNPAWETRMIDLTKELAARQATSKSPPSTPEP